MKTRIISAVLIASMAFAAAACDSKLPEAEVTTLQSFEQDTQYTAEDLDFNVLIPGGWSLERLENMEDGSDIFADHGNYTDAIILFKTKPDGSVSGYGPMLEAIYFADSDSQTIYNSLKKNGVNIVPCDNITVNGKDCLVCYSQTAEENSSPDVEPYTQTHVIIPVTDTSCFHVVIDCGGDVSETAEFGINDSDALKFMESLSPKK